LWAAVLETESSAKTSTHKGAGLQGFVKWSTKERLGLFPAFAEKRRLPATCFRTRIASPDPFQKPGTGPQTANTLLFKWIHDSLWDFLQWFQITHPFLAF